MPLNCDARLRWTSCQPRGFASWTPIFDLHLPNQPSPCPLDTLSHFVLLIFVFLALHEPAHRLWICILVKFDPKAYNFHFLTPPPPFWMVSFQRQEINVVLLKEHFYTGLTQIKEYSAFRLGFYCEQKSADRQTEIPTF